MVRLLTHHFWPLVHETILRWNKNDGLNMAAATAYYGALSFFPLLLVLTSVVGFTIGFYYEAKQTLQPEIVAVETNGENAVENSRSEEMSPEAVQAETEERAKAHKEKVNLETRNSIIEFVKEHTTEAMAQQVEGALHQVEEHAPVQGPIGLLTLLIGAIGLFTQLSASFDRIWHENAPPRSGVFGAVLNALGYRLKAFVTLLVLGILIVGGFAGSFFLEGVRNLSYFADFKYWNTVKLSAGLGLNMLAFTLLYKVVPRAQVRLWDALRGGAFVAVVWELGRLMLAYFILRGNYTAYGVIGSFIAMLLWIYYASLLLFLGAQLAQVLGFPQDNPAALKDS